MSVSAQVTEAHIAKVRAYGYTTEKGVQMAAQFVANNEAAKAERDQLRAELQRLDHEKPWLTETRLTAIAQRMRAEKAESECLNLRADLDAIKAIRNEETARAERAEAEVKKLTGFYNEIVVECGHDRIVREYRQRGELLRDEANRRKEAEAELANIRALANRRNKRDHSQDTTHQLVAALDQALDIAQAELAATKSTLDEGVNCAEKAEREVVRQYARAERAEAAQLDAIASCDAAVVRAERAGAELNAERARLDWLMAGGVCMVQHSGGFYVSRLHAQVSRAAIDSAMKEKTK